MTLAKTYKKGGGGSVFGSGLNLLIDRLNKRSTIQQSHVGSHRNVGWRSLSSLQTLYQTTLDKTCKKGRGGSLLPRFSLHSSSLHSSSLHSSSLHSSSLYSPVLETTSK